MVKVAGPWILLFVSIIFSTLYYRNIFPGNNFSWIPWILALIVYFIILKPTSEPKFWNKRRTLLILFVAFIYFLSHLWNYNIAPWNDFGLFDDAAWDIYFAKNHVFNGTPYQAAFFDLNGVISRETLFHYYISAAFKFFGYNLRVFNGSLIFIGFFTVLFTTLLADEFFSNLVISILVSIITNFFPLIFLNSFVGHRYVIALPLMMASYYFLYSGFSLSSNRRIFLAGLFAGLCLASSVMGKQYILALLLTAFLWLLSNKKNLIKNQKVSLGWIFVFSLLMTAEPLLIYIYYAGPIYSLRESSLIHIFIDNLKSQGLAGMNSNVQTLREVFFAPFTFTRRFLPDFLAIPIAYYPLLLIGSVISVIKRRYEIVLISLIVLVGSFIAGSGDYRILLAGGVWVLAMGFALNETLEIGKKNTNSYKRLIAVGLFFSFLFGLWPSVKYLYTLSMQTNIMYYFPHKDVAISRFLQDVVAGVPNPSVAMKEDEFDRHPLTLNRRPDFLICSQSAFAIIHLYLQNFNDDRILSFCNRLPYNLFSSSEIIKMNLKAIKDYPSTNQDLHLMWEVSKEIEPAVQVFLPYAKYGSSETLSGQISGIRFSIFSVIIKSENIAALKKDLAKLY